MLCNSGNSDITCGADSKYAEAERTFLLIIFSAIRRKVATEIRIGTFLLIQILENRRKVPIDTTVKICDNTRQQLRRNVCL